MKWLIRWLCAPSALDELVAGVKKIEQEVDKLAADVQKLHVEVETLVTNARKA